MMIRSTSPFGELLSLRRAMERMFDDPFFRPANGSRAASRRMPLDVIETPEALVLEAALPGVKPEEVEVSVMGDVLTVTAGSESDAETEDNGYRLREVRHGRVSRTVTLPQGLHADQATASFENGLLRLSIPKAQPADRVRIPVTSPVQGASARIEASVAEAASPASDEGQRASGDSQAA